MLLLAGMQDADRVEAALTNYREATRAEVRCRAANKDDEIRVCARRKADQWRVPFILSANPKNSVPLQTATLLEDHSPPCGEGAFLVRCGYVGASISFDPYGVHYIQREIAP